MPLLGSEMDSPIPMLHNIRVAHHLLVALWLLAVQPLGAGCFTCRTLSARSCMWPPLRHALLPTTRVGRTSAQVGGEGAAEMTDALYAKAA